jgi:formate-dependent nitrite reductase cytochrome c552 subunit
MTQPKGLDYQFFQFLKINNPMIYADIEASRKRWIDCKVKRMYLQDQLSDIKNEIKDLEYSMNDQLMINNCEKEIFLQRKKHGRALKKTINMYKKKFNKVIN